MVRAVKIVGIDYEKCTACGKCIADCPPKLYFKNEEKKVIFEDSHHMCILCGHCIAVCPVNAVITEEMDAPFEFEEAKDPTKIISYENLVKLIRARRSIRQFKNQAIPKDQVEQILEAMRYAPSASNAQSWNYTVLSDPEKISFFVGEVMKIFYLLRKVLKLKHLIRLFVSGKTKELLLDPNTPRQINRLIGEYEAGGDPIFYEAPLVIVLHSPAYGNLAAVDAGIALTHGMFAAQALDIGTCWIGFALEAVQRSKKLRKWLQIPKGRNCYSVMAFGYPAVKFQRAPPRKELQVVYL